MATEPLHRLIFSHCPACAENDDGADAWDPGVGCSADGPTDGCEAVWIMSDAPADVGSVYPKSEDTK